MSSPHPEAMELWLGSRRDDDRSPVTLPGDALLRHMMALGSSGSGKTVLSKVVVEEVARQGIPAICIDPQGDLCSLLETSDPQLLREHGVDPALAERFSEQVDVVVFTPASRTGVALCADPVESSLGRLEGAEQVQAISRTASMIVSLLGYDLDGDEGAGLAAVFDAALTQLASDDGLRGLASLTDHLNDLDTQALERYARFVDRKRIQAACQRLARLEVGARRLLFHQGVPLDIDVMLGQDPQSSVAGKTRISIVYLNTLHHQEDKDFFVAALADRLYAWMLRNPSARLQALFYIDEVAPFVPPVRKPACKDSLQLLFKQARKYGLGCLMATQNPGDVDYKAMAQFGTWALGRLTTRQDLKKVEPTVNALATDAASEVMGALPALKPGQFVLLSPDHLSEATPLQSRWLLTEHATYDEERIAAAADSRWRERFALLDRAGEATPTAAVVAPREPSRSVDATPAGGDEIRRTPIAPTVDGSPIPAETHAEAVAVAERHAPAASTQRAEEPARDDREATAATVVGPSDASQDRERWERVLARRKTMSTREFAQVAGVGERKARALLADLVAVNLAAQFKDGRTPRYWATSRGSRPDLGLEGAVLCVVQALSGPDVQRVALEHRRSKILGLLGDEEALAQIQLVHRSVYKLDFEEKIERSLLGRLVGPQHDQRLGSVYVHPHSLRFVVFTPEDGVVFADRPAEHASEVPDFDGVAAFAQARPADLVIDEADWHRRRSPQDVKKQFTSRFAASPGAVTPVFVPLWKLIYQSRGGAGYRWELVDGLVGKPTAWPEPPA